MSPWIWIGLVTNAVYLAVFVILLVRHRPGFLATVLGSVHLLLGAAMSVAPFRSFIDADYPGFVLGVLEFQKRAATLPTACLLAWAVASAWILASRRRGPALWVVAIGDVLFALNQIASMVETGSNNIIQFGEHLTIQGLPAVLIMGILFVLGPVVSGWWAGTRARQAVA